MIPTGTDYLCILPELVLSVFGILVMLAEPLLGPRDDRKSIGILALIGAVLAVASTFVQARFANPATLAFSGMVRVDAFAVFFHFVVTVIAAVVILASFEYMKVQNIRAGEYYGLILFGTVGMALMSSAIELVLVFIALEISSIATYVLAGFRRKSATSAESSLKYFLLGSFATAFFLYGVALMFGATGKTNIYEIATKLHQGAPTLAFVAVALMIVGLGFKVAAAPFHIWTPDVYEGAPSPVVALMSTGPKAAAFAVLLRILFAASAPGWFWIIWISAVLSMFIGNIGALMQNNVKRMLAYSSIAHAGYLLVAFASLPKSGNYDTGISAAMFYAASYAAMNVGAFIVISHFGSLNERYVTMDDYAGLGRRQPILAAALTVFLMSLIGIPITGGFFAKFYVFSAALQANLTGLVIIGVINSAIGAYYYLRVIVAMYMKEPRESVPATRIPMGVGISLALTLIATIYLGVVPGHVLDYAVRSAQGMLK
jgi:NADH-quinone oxidoreductase subunit N